MTIGTCYFPSYGAALRYYRDYLGVIVRGAQMKELRALVDEKLSAAEIHIGRPKLKPGESLTIKDNRYHIEETAP